MEASGDQVSPSAGPILVLAEVKWLVVAIIIVVGVVSAGPILVPAEVE